MDITEFEDAVIRDGSIESLIKEAIGDDLVNYEIRRIVNLCAFYGMGSISEEAVDECREAGASIQAAVAAGVKTFGPMHAPIVESYEHQTGAADPAKWGKIPGWGHPVLKWPDTDPRAKEICGWMDGLPLIAEQISKQLEGKAGMNVAGALAALAVTRDIDPKRLMGLFIIARTIGLVKRALGN